MSLYQRVFEASTRFTQSFSFRKVSFGLPIYFHSAESLLKRYEFISDLEEILGDSHALSFVIASLSEDEGMELSFSYKDATLHISLSQTPMYVTVEQYKHGQFRLEVKPASGSSLALVLDGHVLYCEGGLRAAFMDEKNFRDTQLQLFTLAAELSSFVHKHAPFQKSF